MKKPAQLGAIDIAAVQSRMLAIRNQQVLLDRDVAALYGVETKEINQAIRDNPGKFPEGFVFQLNGQEFENWKSKILTSNWQRKRCHRDRGGGGPWHKRCHRDRGGGPWRKRCHRDRGADIGASVGIGSASATIRTSDGIVIEAQEMEE